MPLDALGPLRTRLRLTFAGQSESVPAWETALEEGDDAGFFAPDSAVWAVHSSMSPIAGGIRALLTQALHPGVLAGVADHSDYRTDPLARLAGTIRWIFTVTYGDTTAARRACAYVRRRHEPVEGDYVSGSGKHLHYSANDPALAEWVHIAFTDAFLRTYEALHGPVPGGADAYVGGWALAGELMGVADPPRTEAALQSRIEAFDAAGQLAGGPRVAEVVAFLRRPPLDPLLKPGYAMLFGAVLETMPQRHLDLLGLSRPRLGPMPLPATPAAKATLAVVGRALGPIGPSQAAARRRLARLGAV
ncbi:oxygenase MpaB family protein [Sinomonas sp. ASV486]|uniref:oxygenase MpaB family protein n=1 Tax=Sinomonas sp. ASV486 TaxID=3051170 RepID=UPI0027DE31DD|nr:oxygenase MpaB family protein [Sinomonas sp. ASV486]MDQ4490027.1 oxygenase MpaB family protein [Sinomonas sp. ASV486]